MRKYICDRLGFLNTQLDDSKNNVRGQLAEISTDNSKVKLIVIPTNEELAIARDVQEIVSKIN